MTIPESGCLLRILIGEDAKHAGQPLYQWIVFQTRENGLAGATVWRGMMGFGANSRIHTTKILRLSQDLPMVIEIVDQRDKLTAFLDHIDPAIKEGLATIEKAEIRFYRSSKKRP